MRNAIRVGLIAVATLAIADAASAQARRRGCNGTPPDSATLAANPYYLDCDVEARASLKGSEPRLQFMPNASNRGRGDGCLKADFEFVVDTLGVPEYASIKPLSGNDAELEEAVKATIPGLRYYPAKLKGQLVRQLVVYKKKVAYMTRVVVAPAGSPPGPPSQADMRRPLC